MAEGQAQARREAPEPDALIGREINGRFRIVQRIAHGGMGNVYYATQAPLDRPVALKVLHVVHGCDAESRENYHRRFLQEASMLAKLQHPNIVMLFEYGQINNLAGEHYFMAMEYLRGETLAARFRDRGRLSIPESIALVRQIARGLREAHRHGFVHRDLKPSNVIVVPEDETNDIVKLVDFGIGKIIRGRAEPPSETEDITQAGLLLGSPRYMSPEQIRSEPIEPRTDLYALGVTFFQALTGRLPFEGRTSVSLMLAHCSLPPPELAAVCPQQHYPPSLGKLVRAMLEKQPRNRPTLDEFLQRLATVEDELAGVTSATLPGLSAISQRHSPLSLRALQGANTLRSHQPLSLRGSQQALATVQTQLVALRETSPTPSAGAPFTETSGTLSIQPAGQAAALPVRLENPPTSGLTARNYPLWLPAAAAVALLSFGALLATLATAWQTPPLKLHAMAAHVSSALPAPATPLAGAPSASAEASTPHPQFALTIDSTPPGVSVVEAERILGVTPLTLTIDRSSVSSAPRRFVLKRDGYQWYTLEQGDSDVSVHASVALTIDARMAIHGALETPPRRSATAGPVETATASNTSRVGQSKSSGADLEIRPRR